MSENTPEVKAEEVKDVKKVEDVKVETTAMVVASKKQSVKPPVTPVTEAKKVDDVKVEAKVEKAEVNELYEISKTVETSSIRAKAEACLSRAARGSGKMLPLRTR